MICDIAAQRPTFTPPLVVCIKPERWREKWWEFMEYLQFYSWTHLCQ